MLSGIIQSGTKALGGSRFSLVNVLPTALLVAIMAALIGSRAYTSPHPDLGFIVNQFSKDPGWAAVVAVGIFLLAILLRPFQVAIVQLLEGYRRQSAILEFASELATERHRRLENTSDIVVRAAVPRAPESNKFEDVASHAQRLRSFHRRKRRAEMIFNRYPRPVENPSGRVDRLMPTLLGNVLRDGEDNAGRRYGLDMPVVYPRLYPSLSPKLDKAISDQLDMLDTASALCVTFGLLALLTLPLVARFDWWSLSPLVAVLMSVLAYRGAVTTARGHGRLLATAFDLHRFDMLKALHYELPVTPQKELALNKQLSDFLDSRDHDAVKRMSDFRYQHPVAGADDEAKASTGAAKPEGNDPGSDG